MNRVPPDSWFCLISTIDRSRQQRAAIRLTTMLTKQLELQFFSGTTSWALDLKATVRIPLAPPARVAGSTAEHAEIWPPERSGGALRCRISARGCARPFCRFGATSKPNYTALLHARTRG